MINPVDIILAEGEEADPDIPQLNFTTGLTGLRYFTFEGGHGSGSPSKRDEFAYMVAQLLGKEHDWLGGGGEVMVDDARGVVRWRGEIARNTATFFGLNPIIKDVSFTVSFSNEQGPIGTYTVQSAVKEGYTIELDEAVGQSVPVSPNEVRIDFVQKVIVVTMY